MVRFGEPWLQAVRRATSGAALARMAQETQIEIGTLGFRACILGASALLVLDETSLLFRQPENRS